MFKYVKSKFSNNNRDFTSLSSSFLGLSLQNTANSSGSNGGVVDIAEIIVMDEQRAWPGFKVTFKVLGWGMK